MFYIYFIDVIENDELKKKKEKLLFNKIKLRTVSLQDNYYFI